MLLGGAVAGADRNMLRNSLRFRLLSWSLRAGAAHSRRAARRRAHQAGLWPGLLGPCLAVLVPRLPVAVGVVGWELCRQVPSCRQRCVAPWNSAGPRDCALAASPLGRTRGLCSSGPRHLPASLLVHPVAAEVESVGVVAAFRLGALKVHVRVSGPLLIPAAPGTVPAAGWWGCGHAGCWN